jgi:MOSC domain-containing protein YiiM
MLGRVHSLQISSGGVPKRSIERVRIHTLGLEGDVQRMRKIHGGPDRAVCLWSLEVIRMLALEEHAVMPGAAGENVTLTGVPWNELTPGVQIEIGDEVLLEITSHASPCKTIAHLFVDRDCDRISHRSHEGVSRLYARVLRGGEVQVGDRVEWFAMDGGDARSVE